ncbi:hypothetical protein ACSFXN_13030 [Planococcus sp. 1R117A]|uniref:hypothetical protein n=1 Tax=Planococcus sp. 1R117A TaxID=3447020 RepID=UPI003EDBB999
MAHPARIIAEFEKAMPQIPIRQWIYGLFNTTCSHIAANQKGILVATDARCSFLLAKWRTLRSGQLITVK